MAAYRRVHDSHHLQADCPGTLRSVIEYGLFFCAGAGSPDRGALSSKPAAAVDRRDRQTDGQTDGRTDGRPTVSWTLQAPHTMRAVTITAV